MSDKRSGDGYVRWRNSRALTSATAAVILVIVVVIGGVGTFFAFNRPGTSSCTPPGSQRCLAGTNTHDLSVLAPIRSALTGSTIPFTVILPSGEAASTFNFNFGDGTYANGSTASTVDHTFSSPGTFLVSVTATVNGAAHDSFKALVKISVATSYASDSLGIYPTTVGSVVSNSTATAGANAVIGVGGKVTFTAAYTLAPTNPAYSLASPTMINSAGVSGTVTTTATSATGAFTFPNAGIWTVTFVGYGVSATATPAKAYQNYTWTVAVAPSGTNYAIANGAVAVSPHKGQLIINEPFPSGPKTYDPSIDYESAGFEVIYNTYQTLIQYNGSAAGPDPVDFNPLLATCVPGSAQCAALYGNTLQQGTNYTFVIDPRAQFYDPYNGGAHWGVYPSDVMFGIVRTMGFSEFPGVAITAGWILTQSLLPGGSATWDGGAHALFNNTPAKMFAAMSVNDTRWCPAAAMTSAHGCITFHASGVNAFGSSWVFFLELIADALGGGVEPAGWFSASAQGNGVPFWTLGTVTDSGDHPVKLPGGATSTSDPAYLAAIAAIPATGFDAWETSYVNSISGAYAGNTQWRIVASGPYYLFAGQVHTSYELKANPYYVANANCNDPHCEPAAGHYAADVQVTWTATPTPAEQALASGVADFAIGGGGYLPTGDTALVLQLAQQGKIGSLIVPTLNLFQVFFNQQINLARTHVYTTSTVNIKSDFFASLGLRQFLIHAYPYATIESQINTKDGIQYFFNVGGAIPQFMGNYYPKDIPWPLSDPDTNPAHVGGAAWWWAQIQNPASPYFDLEATMCTAANPCQFPVYGQLGLPDGDQRNAIYSNIVSALTGGAIKISLSDITFEQYLLETSAPPGSTGLTVVDNTGWLPDYPDPTDYTVPYYYPDSAFTLTYAVAEAERTYNSTLPSGGACPTDFNFYVNISTTGGAALSSGYVNQNCQGAAYDAMIGLLLKAGALPSGAARVFVFDQAEHIAQQLGFMVDQAQQNVLIPYASWIDPATLDTNVVVGGSGDMVWFLIGGNGVY